MEFRITFINSFRMIIQIKLIMALIVNVIKLGEPAEQPLKNYMSGKRVDFS